jgi:hypothetical protein
VHRDLGSKALGLIGFALAGCAPVLYVNGPDGTLDAYGVPKAGAPTPPGPTPICEVSTTGPSFAAVVCRDAVSPTAANPQDGPRIESTPASRDQPSLNDEGRPAPCAAAEPDPCVGPAVTHLAGDDSSFGDYLAPDPFTRPRREARPSTSGPLTEDDLAPDPFGGSRYETRRRAGKPIAEDDLAPDPLAGPPREARERARETTCCRRSGAGFLPRIDVRGLPAFPRA